MRRQAVHPAHSVGTPRMPRMGAAWTTAPHPRRPITTAARAAADGKPASPSPSSSASSSAAAPPPPPPSSVSYADFIGASSSPAAAAAAPPPPAAAVAAMAARTAQAAVVAAAAAATKRRGPAAATMPASLLPDWASKPGVEKLRARTRSGAMVYAAAVQEEGQEGRGGGGWRVAVSVSAADVVRSGRAPAGQAPWLHWGLYRAPGTAWRLPPESALPEGTQREPATGAARTPMVAAAGARRPGVWTLELRVPRRYAPVQLGFALWYPGDGDGKAVDEQQPMATTTTTTEQEKTKKKKKKSLPLPPSLGAAVAHAASRAAGGGGGGAFSTRPLAASQSAAPHYDPSPEGAHFALSLGIGRGTPTPLGPSIVSFSPGATGQPSPSATLAAASGGATPTAPTADVNFAVYSRHAGSMTLCIFRRPSSYAGGKSEGGGGGYLEIPLDPAAGHHTGDVWHVAVRGLRDPCDLLYGWRAGPGPGGRSWMAGGAFHPGFLLLDPYAPAAALARLPPDEALLAAGAPALPPGSDGGARHALLGSLAPLLEGAESSLSSGEDPGGWRAAARLAESVAPAAAAAAGAGATGGGALRPPPRRPLASSVLVELDVRDFASSPSASPSRRGTYLGALERLGELAAAGATAVLLRGAMLTDRAVAAAAAAAEGGDGERRQHPPHPLPPPARRPLSYFAPEVALCCDEGQEEEDGEEQGPTGAAAAAEAARPDALAPRQLKALVAAAHARGLEVLLEADFCLTADASGGGSLGAGARLQSLAGLDGALYLRGGGGYRGGGVLNAGQPAVRALALAALRRWASEYRLDGFVLANAENLAQDALGAVQDSPPFAEELAADGALGAFRGVVGGGGGGGSGDGSGGSAGGDAVKIIAAVSDRSLLPRGGGRGFPHYGRLAEWNARFGEDVLALLRDNGSGGGGCEGGTTASVLSTFATRMAGSPDLFAPAPPGEDWPGGLAAGRAPAWGLNALQPPGSPRAPRELFFPAGGGDGGEGEEEEMLVVARSFLLAQAVAAGTPALDWRVLESREAGGLGLARFAGGVLALRRRYAGLLAPAAFFSGGRGRQGRQQQQRDLRWHAADGPSGAEPDWSGQLAAQGGVAGANFVAFSVFENARERRRTGAGAGGAASPSSSSAPSAAVYVAFNPDPLADVTLVPPPPPAGARWRVLVDTSRRVGCGGGALPADADAVQGVGGELLAAGGGADYVLPRRAALMLDAVPEEWLDAAPASAAAARPEEIVGGPAAAMAATAPPPPPLADAAARAARYLG